MNKIGGIILLAILGAAGFMLFQLFMPTVNDMASTANTTIAASSNITNYPGATQFLVASPWVLLLTFPVIIVIVAIVYLKQQ